MCVQKQPILCLTILIIRVKHSSNQINSGSFHSLLPLGSLTTPTTNTTGCTTVNCVPMDLEAINATCRGTFSVSTNDNSPFCSKFIQIHRSHLYATDCTQLAPRRPSDKMLGEYQNSYTVSSIYFRDRVIYDVRGEIRK
jgi:hypothetical protein